MRRARHRAQTRPSPLRAPHDLRAELLELLHDGPRDAAIQIDADLRDERGEREAGARKVVGHGSGGSRLQTKATPHGATLPMDTP